MNKKSPHVIQHKKDSLKNKSFEDLELSCKEKLKAH